MLLISKIRFRRSNRCTVASNIILREGDSELSDVLARYREILKSCLNLNALGVFDKKLNWSRSFYSGTACMPFFKLSTQRLQIIETSPQRPLDHFVTKNTLVTV